MFYTYVFCNMQAMKQWFVYCHIIAGNEMNSTYSIVLPFGDFRTTAALAPSFILDPSKCMIQYSVSGIGVFSMASVQSAMKSVNTWDLIAVLG